MDDSGKQPHDELENGHLKLISSSYNSKLYVYVYIYTYMHTCIAYRTSGYIGVCMVRYVDFNSLFNGLYGGYIGAVHYPI